MFFNDSYLLIVTHLWSHLSLSMSWTYWLAYRWDVTFGTRLQKDYGFHFGSVPLFHSFTLREAACHVMSCPLERPALQGTDVSSWQSARRTWGLLTATSVSLKINLLRLLTATWISLEADPPAPQPSLGGLQPRLTHWLHSCRDSEPEAPS